jgi:hypothetical protein
MPGYNGLGLLHPVVIRHDGALIAGERRLAACKELGWETVRRLSSQRDCATPEVQSGEVRRVREDYAAGTMVLTAAQRAIGGRAFRGLVGK